MYETIFVTNIGFPPSLLGKVSSSRKKMPNWDTLSYPIVFLVRRSIFVLITFGLFKYPGIQINVFIYTSLLYIIYITHYPKFDPISIMYTEVVNESIFLLICYHMVLFSNLIWAPELKLAVGISLIFCLISLLFGNTVFIAIVSCRGAKNKKRLAYIKKQHDSIIRERNTSL